MFLKLNAPESIKSKNESDIQTVRQRFGANKSKLSVANTKKLEKLIRRNVEEWERGTAGLRSTLRALNDFHEGKPENVDFPFGPMASSNIDVRLSAGYGRLLRAAFIRSVFADPARTYVALPTPEITRKNLNEVERGVNWASENDCNLNDLLKDSFIPTYRDGTAMLHGRWETRIERGYDYKSYASVEEFQADYPDAETAGVSDKKYDEAIDFLSTSVDTPLRVEYQTDFLSKNGATFSLCPLARHIWGPLYIQDIKRLTIYGYTYLESGAEFNQNAKEGYYEPKAVEACRKSIGGWQYSGDMDSWEESRSQLEGISSQNSEEVSYRLAWLAVRADLDEDGIEERYSIIYDLDKNKALRIEDYALPRNTPCMVPLRLVRRDGRYLGLSLLKDVEPLFREINALHRHRSNTRRITDSVTLLIPEGLKNSPSFDLGAEYGHFIPGRPLYLPDNYMTPALRPAQLVVQSTSKTSESVDEEAFVQRYSDLLTGASPGQSGRESPIDPNAPASKTAMLLNRADIRVEDLITEWRRTVPDAIDLMRALYQQNATGDVSVVTSKGDELESQKISLAAFADPRIKCSLKPISPATSPDQEMSKIAALAQGALQFMLPVRLKPDILIQLWDDYVAASRIARPERFQLMQDGQGGVMMNGQPMDPMQMLGMMAQGQAPQAPASGAKPSGNGGGSGAEAIKAMLEGTR